MLERKQSTVYGVAIGCGVILAVVAILVFLYRRHLKKKYALYLEPNDSFVVSTCLVIGFHFTIIKLFMENQRVYNNSI